MTTVIGRAVNDDFIVFLAGHSVADAGHGRVNICYYESYSGDNSTIWQNANPWTITMPFTSQLGIVILSVRLFYVLLNFAGQPRFLAELIAGLVLGNGLIGPQELYSLHLRPMEQVPLIGALGSWGILYYTFMVTLEMDFAKLVRVDRKILSCTVAGILVPLGSGAGLHFLFQAYHKHDLKNDLGPWFWAIVLAFTSFYDIARILSDLKLLNTDIGRTALASAFLNDLVVWTLFAVTMTCLNARKDVLLYVPAIVFLLFCWFFFRPLLSRALASSLLKRGSYSDTQVYAILTGIFVFGFISDACGCDSVVGVFMYGLALPKEGDLAQRVSDKLERIMIAIFLPTFFMVVGVKANLGDLADVQPGLVLAIILLAALPKIVSILIVSICYGMRFREGIALGTLMNTKGITALIIVGAARDKEIFSGKTFSTIVFVLVGMMLLVKPIPYWACKSTGRLKQHQNRTLERTKQNSQLRVVVCSHAGENLPGMINLLQFSRQKKQQPITVFAVNLVELTRRSTAMLILQDSPISNLEKRPSHHETEAVKSIVNSVRNYAKRAHALSVRAITVVSPYTTMHKDILNIAKDNRASLILVPFHKQQKEDEFLETENHSIRLVNQKLLTTAPCSVGIFIDRGFSSIIRQIDSEPGKQLRVTVLFSGGTDNREALAYACRMVGAKDVSLTVVRFIPGSDALSIMEEGRKGKCSRQVTDDECINEFRFKMMCEEFVNYVEKVVNTGYEILTSIRHAFSDSDLYILGKGKGVIPPFELGFLSEWTECMELGLLGDALSTSGFADSASILVIQQHE